MAAGPGVGAGGRGRRRRMGRGLRVAQPMVNRNFLNTSYSIE